MQIAVATAKEDCLQIGGRNAIKHQLVPEPRRSRARFRTFRPSHYRSNGNFERFPFWKRSILELDSPIVLRNMGWLADTERGRIRRLTQSVSWTGWIMAAEKRNSAEYRETVKDTSPGHWQIAQCNT